MLRYIGIRVMWIFIVLVTFLSLLFIVIRLVPEYPPTEVEARQAYYEQQVQDGYMTRTFITDPETIYQIRIGEFQRCSKCFLRQVEGGYYYYEPVPIISQYANWIKNIVTKWNWGNSTRVRPNVPVFEVIESRMGVTIKLNLISLFIYMPIGFALGIFAALRKNKMSDNIISIGVMIFISIPSFVTMFILMLIFAYGLKWLPSQFPPADATGLEMVRGYVLPVAALSFGPIAGLTRLTRAELTEVLTSDFILLARTKGLTRTQAVLRHALRNSLVPLVPSIIYSFVGLLTGSVVIEQIYGIPGMGMVYLRAMTQNNFDYNLILAISFIYTIISLFAVLLVDLAYGIVDPRIRMGARK